MGLYDNYKTDRTLETEGHWFPLGDENAPAFLFARAGGANTKYQQLLAQRVRPYQRMLNDKNKTPDASLLALVQKIAMETWTETCLKGWKNVDADDGESILYSVENARKLFTDLPDLFTELFEQSNSLSFFLEGDTEDAVKN